MMMWMPRYLKMRWELYRYTRAMDRLDATQPPNTAEAHESGEVANYWRESDALGEWRQLILTRYWESKAGRYGIPMPDRNDNALWGKVEYDNDESQPSYLTDEGVTKVRTAIREEQKHRREVLGFWCTVIVGVIGALTGLASVLKS